METLSKVIIFISDSVSGIQHQSFMEDMGSKIIKVNETGNVSDKLQSKFDLIIIDYTCSFGKNTVNAYKDILGKWNCLLLAADDAEIKEAKNLLPDAEIILKPVSPAQLNQKAAEMLGLPSRRAIKILIRMQFIEEPKAPFALGTMIDISENGMLIETEKHLRMDIHIKISFYLSETGGFVEIEGQIIRETKSSSPKIKCYGIRFTRVEQQFQDKINRFVLKLKTKRTSY